MNRRSSSPISVSDGLASTPNASEETQKGSPKPPPAFLLIIILVAIGLGGVLLGKYLYGPKAPQIVTNVPPTPRVEALTPTPTPDVMENWKTYTSKKGYTIKYPSQLNLKENDEGFFTFSEQPDDDLESLSFYIDERGEKTIAERKQYALVEFVDPVFKDVDKLNGFTVEGKLGPGFGEGLYVKSAYIDLRGKELILGCDTNKICQERILDQILSTFRFLD